MAINQAKKISVITVSFNTGKDVEETCRSIVNQTNDNFEWIVIDGASTDGSLDILKKYRKHAAFFVSEKDRGIYDAMNKGIMHAHGEYVLFMNGGDRFENHSVLEKFSRFNSKGDVLYGDFHFLNSDGSKVKTVFPKTITKFFFLEHCINHQSSFIKRKLFKDFGLYNMKYRIGADYEKWLLYLKKGVKFQKLPLFVSVFKNFDGYSSSNKHLQYKREEQWAIMRRYFTSEELIRFGKNKIFSLEDELNEIKSTRYFKAWRKYCLIKERLFGQPVKR